MGDNSLGGNSASLLVGFGLFLVIFANSVEEVNSRSRQFKVLDANVNPLGDDAISDLFVDNHSDGAGVDVENGTGAAVVVFVWHALVDGSVNDDVDDVTDFVGGERFGDVDSSVLFEAFSEFVSGFALVAVAVGHLIILK